MMVLRGMYQDRLMYLLPVKAGQEVYLLIDREIQTQTVEYIKVMKGTYEVFLTNGECVYPNEYCLKWFTSKDEALTHLSNLELVRVGLLPEDEGV